MFPRFERARRLVELVSTLRTQHQVGRRITERIRARDTLLFPTLHEIVSRSEYDALGEDFERREHEVFGEDGFEHAVSEVDAIERTLGIEDLAQFTPRN